MEAAYSDEQLEAAIEALVEPERFRAAERRVAAAAPQLQRVLAAALAEGGWFEGAQQEHLAKLAAIEDPEQRIPVGPTSGLGPESTASSSGWGTRSCMSAEPRTAPSLPMRTASPTRSRKSSTLISSAWPRAG